MARCAAVDGVGEGPQEVEDCAPTELFADGCDEAHTRMEGGSEEEGVVCTAIDGVESVWFNGGENWGLRSHRGQHVG